MHDYTIVRVIHEDRLAQLTREADAFRLAAMVRPPVPWRARADGLLGLLRRIAVRGTVGPARGRGVPASAGGEVPVTPAAE